MWRASSVKKYQTHCFVSKPAQCLWPSLRLLNTDLFKTLFILFPPLLSSFMHFSSWLTLFWMCKRGGTCKRCRSPGLEEERDEHRAALPITASYETCKGTLSVSEGIRYHYNHKRNTLFPKTQYEKVSLTFSFWKKKKINFNNLMAGCAT